MQEFIQQSKKQHGTPEPSGHTTGWLCHANSEEAEENDFKHNLMKMMESIKKEIKNSHKEIEEKTNRENGRN